MRYSETLVKTCTARVLDLTTQSRETRTVGEGGAEGSGGEGEWEKRNKDLWFNL